MDTVKDTEDIETFLLDTLDVSQILPCIGSTGR